MTYTAFTQPGRAPVQDLARVIQPADIRHFPRFATLLDCVYARVAPGALPSRGDIVPGDFKTHLPYVFLLDVDSDENDRLLDVRVRLLGTELVHHYGEVTGQSFKTYRDAGVRSRVFDQCQKLLQTREPCAIEVKGISAEKWHVTVNVLYIPVSRDGRRIDQAFGGMVFELGDA